MEGNYRDHTSERKGDHTEVVGVRREVVGRQKSPAGAGVTQKSAAARITQKSLKLGKYDILNLIKGIHKITAFIFILKD